MLSGWRADASSGDAGSKGQGISLVVRIEPEMALVAHHSRQRENNAYIC
jgi:hypothetical protein